MLLLIQAGIVATLENLVKDFIGAGNDEKKQIVSRMEEEVEKLKGATARLISYFLLQKA